MKKDGLFDVTMGAYDGAEVCELVGTFLLDKISEKYEKNSVGLYRDNGLSVFKNKSGTQLERIKKNLQKTFKDFINTNVINSKTFSTIFHVYNSCWYFLFTIKL